MASIGVNVTTTPTTEARLSPSVRRQLLTELKAYQEIKAERDALQRAMDEHKENIGAIRSASGVSSIEIDGFRVVLITPTRSTLDKKALLLNGVTMGQIENSTITKATKPYEKVTCPGDVDREF